MNKKSFQASAWYHGVTLTERIASLKANPNKKLKVEIDTELAQRRMQRWRKQSPFTDDSYFAQRLDLDGITEDELFYLLGEPVEALQERSPKPPAWLVNLAQALSAATNPNPESLPLPEKLQGKNVDLFLYAIEPLIRQGRDRVQAEVIKLSQTRTDLPFEPTNVVDLLLVNLPEKLLNICTRTMVLELQIASLQGLLKVDTPEERFYQFFEQLRQPEKLIALLQEYPILARQLMICIDQWVRFSLEFLQHLCTDWDEIKTTFSLEKEPGQLVEWQGGQGDYHNGGRAVVIAKFSSGFQLVYKPRSLATDIHFQQLLTWLNERGDRPPFRTFKIIARQSYGWAEFISTQTCTSSEEVQRFYERQGGYLALLYVLEANDFHYENLIAAGEHPILIDLESLFQPCLAQIDSTQSHLLAQDTLNHSVLRVGLLPQRRWSKGDNKGIDVSGLGAEEGQLMPSEVPYWEKTGTDQMRLKTKQMKSLKKNNQPTLNGNKVNFLDYGSAIAVGFTKVYNLLLKHRDELLSSTSPLASFASDEVRVLLRQTKLYTLLLRDSFHPKMLRNGLERDKLFDRLWFPIEYKPHLAKVISAEREDLWNGDVPMFRTRPNSCALFTSSGEEIKDFFAESGMALVKRSLKQLSKSDLQQQLRFIEGSIASIVMSSGQSKWQTYPLTEPQKLASREQLITAAIKVGERLEELALRGQDDASWIGFVSKMNEGNHSFISLGSDLYHGLSGITLFLAYLGAITKSERYKSLARAALNTVRFQLEKGRDFFKSIGGFNGWGGVIYTLSHLGMLWDEPALIAEAQDLVKLLPPLIEEDEGLTIILGTAGCLVSLLNLYRCSPSESTLATAIACGDRLIVKAQKMRKGIGWIIPDKVQPLTGFGHGAAGIAWALLELWSVTGEKRFRRAALEGIAYERSMFCSEVGNWFDLRSFKDTVLSDNDNQNNQHKCMTAWCHGAPGIGLARLRSLQYLDDREIRTEINTALKTTLTGGFGYNHSLCHGDLGNLELFLQASQTLNAPQWNTQIDRYSAIILESIDKYGWLCGMATNIETPGLMTGLAGIGYGLLRLAEPEHVPSVLVLESPKSEFLEQQNSIAKPIHI